MESEKLKCPGCGGMSEPHAAGLIVVHLCGACGGAWFNNLQLAKLLNEGSKTLDDLMGFEPAVGGTHPIHSSFQCPICIVPLHTTFLSGMANVKTHTCYACAGIFLECADLEELDKEMKTPGSTRLNSTLAEDFIEANTQIGQLDAQIQEDHIRTALLSQFLYRNSALWL